MKPELGREYTRKEISKMLGGEEQIYLPNKDGKVLCGCFDPAEEWNPGAPEQVLYGSSSSRRVEKAADMVYRQGTPVPIFMRQVSRKFKYIGDYRCIGHSRDSSLLKELREKYPERKQKHGIDGILYFEKA